MMERNTNRREFIGVGALVAAGSVTATLRAGEAPTGLVNGHGPAAAAGNAVLADGGNAVDAIVAAALVAGVVAVPSAGIGGYGGHLVVARPDGKVTAIDFNSTAPAAARADMFQANDQGAVPGRTNMFGWRAAGVPGTLAGLQFAIDRLGTRKFAELVQPAIRSARDGFPVAKGFAAALRTAKERFARDPGSARLFYPRGEPLAEGATFRNPDLARLLETLAEKGRVDDFYSGAMARKIADAFRANGGLVTAEDLAAYRPVECGTRSLEWRGHTIHTPPPTAGGLTVLEALAILKELFGADEIPTLAARLEALRIAWDDRLRRLGDPRHADVPVDLLLSDNHIRAGADRVRLALKANRPVEARSDGRPAGGTIHLNAIDARGMAAAMTFTHGGGFGSQVTVDGLGLVLGHGMSRFDPRPGRPNSVAPGKRPLHNMCPTIVLKGDKPVLALGATGGRRIVNTVFDVLSYHLGAGKRLTEAVQAPRLHTEGDLALTVEKDHAMETIDRWKKTGYAVKIGAAATLSALQRDATTGQVTAAGR